MLIRPIARPRFQTVLVVMHHSRATPCVCVCAGVRRWSRVTPPVSGSCSHAAPAGSFLPPIVE